MHAANRRRIRSLSAAWVLGLLGAEVAEATTPLGPSFQVNSDDPGEQYDAKVESDGVVGGFVVVWAEYGTYSVEGRLFDASGSPIATDFQVNQTSYTSTNNYYNNGATSVAMDPAGGFVVTWYGIQPPLDDPYDYIARTFLRLFEADGDPRGDEFTTNTVTFEYDQAVNPEISIDAEGDFVVVWEGAGLSNPPGYPQDEDLDESVFGQVYDSDGNPENLEFQADIYDYGYQGDHGYLDVARAQTGVDSFVVVWEGNGPGIGAGYYAYPSYGIHGRRFLVDVGVAKQFKVATDVEYNLGTDPQIAMDAAGNFTVAWQDVDTGRIAARRFGKAGARLGDSFFVSEDFGYKPAIDADNDGNFIVVWNAGNPVGQVFDALGNRRGGEFEVENCGGCAYDNGPDVAALGDEEFVVTWNAPDTDNGGIFARRFAMGPLTEVLLGGKSLQIRNGAADLPPFRRATWKASGLNIASPARLSDDDPRCNGDPSGTVKATMRFFSNTTGQDTGALGLPCQNWSATGPSSTDPLALQGYKYKDPQLADSLCTSIVVKRTKLVKATCKEIAYDLVSGVDQGIVHAVLSLGQVQYCTSFDDYNGRDGSDGILFQGKDAPAPTACPTP